ncbi:MAG: hypothetical protein HOC18_02200 [Candidatus Marinimicrobia bacterium]|jgi:hypothetical protein|nr:hypothetical protein [Candidatus Neomarinimicrobiota bacterium]
MLDIPKKYYEQEGFLSSMGIGYTAALAITGLGLFHMISKMDISIPSAAIVGGGMVATWGYLKTSGVLY